MKRPVDEFEFSYGSEALNRIFQMCPVALGLSTIHDGRIVDVNERWLALFGYTRDEVIGRTNAELRLNVDAGRRQQIASQALTMGVVRDAEARVRTKSGEIRDIMISALPLERAGIAELWISVCVEITDRKQAEAERDQMLAREQVARAEAEQALEKLRAVYAITDTIEMPGPLGELLGEVLKRLRRTLQIDDASVLLLDDEGKALYLRASEGPEPRRGPIPDLRIPIGSGVSGKIVVEGRPMIIDDYSAVDRSAIPSPPNFLDRTRSVMGVPFRIADRIAGVVVVSTRTHRKFNEEELRLLLLAADRVGPAIERGRLIERIRTGLERRRALSRRLLTAQEEERRRVAVELHDELGQILTAVKINLESLERSPDAHTLARLPAMIASVDDALQRIKDIALDLRPSVLDDLGLEAAMRWFADRSTRNAGLAAHLSIDALPALEANLQTACFRVMQEALTNVERHARARQVWIDLHVLDGALELSVRDDGIGFDVAAAKSRAISGGSVGILGMQERVALMGGEYEIVRIPSGGTEVRARFPLAHPEAP
jgi:PAS domain S-box-containing protein